MPSTHLLVLAPSGHGHHAEYVRWIVQGATRHGIEVVTVAGPTNLLGGLEHVAQPGLEVPVLESLASATSAWASGQAMRVAIRQAVESTRPTHVLLTYLDHALLGLATGLRFRDPLRLSGILFRPTLHEPTPESWRDRLREIQKRLALRLAARNPHLDRVFTLDPDAVAPLSGHGLRAAYVPDPVEPASPTERPSKVRARFTVAPGRQLAVLFGSLEDRKGVLELLDALPLLEPGLADRLAVVIAGRTYDDLRPRLLDALSRAQSESQVQIVLREGFLPDTDLVNLVATADLVLAPYQNHVGSSGVILRAAAAGTPVLAPQSGLMGREVRRNTLGVTVDTSDPHAIARGLADALQKSGFDPMSAAAYAAAHSVNSFQTALFE